MDVHYVFRQFCAVCVKGKLNTRWTNIQNRTRSFCNFRAGLAVTIWLRRVRQLQYIAVLRIGLASVQGKQLVRYVAFELGGC